MFFSKLSLTLKKNEYVSVDEFKTYLDTSPYRI